jgi:hypothetical protein
VLLKKWGALAGMFMVEPLAARLTSPRKVNSILALQDREHLLEVVTVRRRATD